jgi:hypothetical protein
MKKLLLISIGIAVAVGAMAQDLIVVRGANSFRAGYSVPIRTLDAKSGLTFNGWVLTDVSSVQGSFADLRDNFIGFGVHYPIYKYQDFTVGAVAGWSGSAKRITQRVSDGEWGLGLFLRYNW